MSHTSLTCPLPLQDYPEITLAHGAGGALTHELIEKLIKPALASNYPDEGHDGAVMVMEDRRIAMTTDSYVVQPLEFPGGDIGHMAVCGTLNDLAMCGARPRHLSLGLIIEEGLATDTLWRVMCSIGETCRVADVAVVTGDTKVVDRGNCDGLFLNMTGIGEIVARAPVNPSRIAPGDAILISGDIGRHGIAVLSAREGLSFETDIKSDCAPVHEMVLALLDEGLDIHCLRDLTRGGLATTLVELAQSSSLSAHVIEANIPVSDGVNGAAELLGLDPLYIANEGRFAIYLPQDQAARALAILKRYENCAHCSQIGTIAGDTGTAVLQTAIGSTRQLDLLTGEHLPRIC